MHFSGTLLASLITFLSQRGFTTEELCERFQIDLSDLQGSDASFDEKKIQFVWQTACELSGDPLLGLHMGENSNLTAIGVVGNLIQNSPTVREAIENACKFMNLLTNAFTMKMVERREYFTVIITPNFISAENFEFGLNQILDMSLVFILKEHMALTLHSTIPEYVELSHCNQEKEAEYERVFQCPVKFGTSKSGITFKSKLLAQRIITSDYKLLSILKNHAETQLAQIEKRKSFASVVRQTLWNQSGFNAFSAQNVASHLNMTVRHMQRKLNKEGVQFQEISDEIKKNIAIDYLMTGIHQVKEISSILGYNEVSSFTRSFKKWTGYAPTEFMKSRRVN